MATTIVNPPANNDSSNSSGNGMGMILGIILLLVVVVILVVYLFPMVVGSFNSNATSPEINVPKDINVNIDSKK